MYCKLMNEFVALNYLPFSFSCPFPAIIKELEMKYSSLKHVWDDIFSWYDFSSSLDIYGGWNVTKYHQHCQMLDHINLNLVSSLIKMNILHKTIDSLLFNKT